MLKTVQLIAPSRNKTPVVKQKISKGTQRVNLQVSKSKVSKSKQPKPKTPSCKLKIVGLSDNQAQRISSIVKQSGITVPNTATQFKHKSSKIPIGYGGPIPTYWKVYHEVENYLKTQYKDRSIFFDIVVSDLAVTRLHELQYAREFERFKYTIIVKLHESKRKQAEKLLNLEIEKKDMLNDYMAYIVENAGHIFNGFKRREIKTVALKSMLKANQIANFDKKRQHKIIWSHCMVGFLAELQFSKDFNLNLEMQEFDGARFFDFQISGIQFEVKYLNNKKLQSDTPIINRTSSGVSKIEKESWDYMIIYTDTPIGMQIVGYVRQNEYKKYAQVVNTTEIVIDKKHIRKDLNIIKNIINNANN